MSKISKEQVKKVSQLARLELNDEEIEHHSKQLEKILDYIDQLEKINTENIPCTTRAIEVVNVLRSDINQKFEANESIIDLAPSREENFFKVPKIIKN
tara:strand:+ start:116 stop:409 length:294 start_codon:yes stop_codon:yes gene_type:complete